MSSRFVFSLLAAAAATAQGFQDLTLGSPFAAIPHSVQPQSTGIAAGDFDGDGDQDVVIAGDIGQPIFYLRNDGVQFVDRTAAAGLGVAPAVRSLLAADIDNDGDLDLFACVWRAAPRLFVNDGTGVFSEQAAARGLTQTTANYCASFGDYDRDGWLDLYLGNHIGSPVPAEANILYRNVGNGVFVDQTAVAGVGDLGYAYAVAFFDHDEDGWPDLIVVNDQGYRNRPNNVYHNNRDGTFTSVAGQLGMLITMDGMGVDFVDAFNDGGCDVIMSDTPPDHMFMVYEPVFGTYTMSTMLYGMAAFSPTAWAVNFFDFDNDGWQDLHSVHDAAANRVYRNPGSPPTAFVPWPEVAGPLGLAQSFSQFTSMLADFDNDGGIDVCHRYATHPTAQAPTGAALLRNAMPRGNWLKLRTVGTASNRDGIGARVDLWTGARRQRQWVRSGTGFLASSDLRLHYGLGTAAQADLVQVRWPSGQEQWLTDVPANQIVTVVEPRLQLRVPAVVGGTTFLDLTIGSDAGLFYGMGLAFAGAPGTPLGDGRTLPIVFDDLTAFTIQPGNPVLPGCIGLLDAQGRASSPLIVPNLPGLSGLTFYVTAITIDPPRFPFARTVFPRALPIHLP